MAVRNNLLYFVQANGGDISTNGQPLQYNKSYLVFDAFMEADKIKLIVDPEVDCVIDWGDGKTTANTGGGEVLHNYAASGRYLITISGKFYGFDMPSSPKAISAYFGTNAYGVGTFANSRDFEFAVIDSPFIAEIGDSAFEGCYSLAGIFFPTHNGVYGLYITKIGDKAFMECLRMEHFAMPYMVTELGDSAFRNCEMLRSIELNEGLEEIGRRAFRGCYRLKEIALPLSLTAIGEQAFKDCKSLRKIEYMASDVTPLLSALPLGDVFMGCKIARIVASSMDNARAIETTITEHYGGFATVLDPDSECKGINELLDEINGEVV